MNKGEKIGDGDNSLHESFSKAEEVISDIESGQFSSNDMQGRIKDAIGTLEDLTRAVSTLCLFSSNEQVEDIPTSSLPYLLIPCYLGVAQHNIATTDPIQRRDQLRLAKVYYIDFIRRIRNYGFDFESYALSLDSGDLSDTPQPSIKKFSGEELREQKIARFRRQKELKQAMQALKQQKQLNNSDDSIVRELHLTLIKYWIEKILEELGSIEDELPLVEMMGKRQLEMKNGSELINNRAASTSESAAKPPGLKPFIITRSEQQKAVFGLGYPSIPTMTVDEWYNQRFGDNAPSTQSSQKPGCSDREKIAVVLTDRNQVYATKIFEEMRETVARKIMDEKKLKRRPEQT
ncbi:TAP42-like family protein [Necator americanus]|uniref:TAP42-like family protein n=1 Tax=Necator americanus TaxID=51031 RepID=W2SXV1_NECAM|nr:TAP42-like family protein [Necator americanus]ETN74353.1 TAP42-like family protein [Necator americanus]